MAHTAERDLAARRTLRGFGPPQPSGILRDPRSRRRSILRIAAISKLGSKAGEEALWPIGPACLSIRNAAAYAIARSHRAKTFRPTIELIERTSELGGTHARYFRAPCDHRSLGSAGAPAWRAWWLPGPPLANAHRRTSPPSWTEALPHRLRCSEATRTRFAGGSNTPTNIPRLVGPREATPRPTTVGCSAARGIEEYGAMTLFNTHRSSTTLLLR